MSTVSVIVPCFNTAPYLKECLDSLLTQTFHDWEAICIDDGSIDATPAVLTEYAAKDHRIQWFPQPNSGLSATRNRALEIASGTYVLFLDSDDKLVPDALEKLVRKADDDRLDVLLFSATTLFETDTLRRDHPSFESIYKDDGDFSCPRSGPELLRDLVMAKEYRSSACLQMNRKSHLDENGLRFLNGILHEDNLFTFVNLLSASRAARMNEPLYVRRVRLDSIMTAPKRLRNAQGYAFCAREMFRYIWEKGVPPGMEEASAIPILQAVRGAQRAFRDMSEEERRKVDDERPFDRLWLSILRNARTEEEFQAQRARCEKLSADVKRRKKEIEMIRRSWTFRLGLVLLAIPRFLGMRRPL